VPGWIEALIGVESCQHCRTEFPSAAAVVVMLKWVAAVVRCSTKAKTAMMQKSKVEKRDRVEVLFGKGWNACTSQRLMLVTSGVLRVD